MAGEDETAKHQQFLKNHIWENFAQSNFQDTELIGNDGSLLINRVYLAFIFPDLNGSVLGRGFIENILIIAPDLSTGEIKDKMKSISVQFKALSDPKSGLHADISLDQVICFSYICFGFVNL